jgi:hypothetical protein
MRPWARWSHQGPSPPFLLQTTSSVQDLIHQKTHKKHDVNHAPFFSKAKTQERPTVKHQARRLCYLRRRLLLAFALFSIHHNTGTNNLEEFAAEEVFSFVIFMLSSDFMIGVRRGRGR